MLQPPYADLPQTITEEPARNDHPTILTPAAIFSARLVAFSPQDVIRNAGDRPLSIVHGTAAGGSMSIMRNNLRTWRNRSMRASPSGCPKASAM